MVKLKTIKDAISFINKTHASGLSSTKGLRIYSSFRQSDGKKIIFSIISGARISSFDESGSDGIIVQQSMKGVLSKYNSMNVHHSLYLSGIRVINVHEAFTEFLTTNKIDYMYVLSSGPTFTLLSSLEMLPVPPILGQWVYSDEYLDDSIDNLGKTVVKTKKKPKIDLDLS